MSNLLSTAGIGVAGALAVCIAQPAFAAPVVTLSPATTHPQGATKVSGAGFGANEAVDIFYDTTDVALDVTDAAGKFGTEKITVPTTAPPGDHWITVIGRKNGDAAHKRLIVSTAWVSHGFNERGRRRNPYENLVNTANANRLDVAWSAATGLGISSSPAIAQVGSATYNPFVFVGSNDAKLYAFDIAGEQKWSAATGGGIFSSPAIANGSVYVGSSDGKVYAFKAANGAPAWSGPVFIGGPVDQSPAVADGLVFIGSQSKLFALHASDGSTAWSQTISGASFFDSSPAVADGIVYAGATDKNLYALHEADGTPAWPAFPAGAVIESSPAVANGIVYFGSEDRNVYAVNAKTGVAAWPSPVLTGAGVDSSPAVSNGVVFVGSNDRKLYALNATTGATIWTGLTGGLISLSSPVVANGVVYIGAQDGKVYAFATTCSNPCSPLWSGATGAAITSSPMVADNMLFAGSADHSLYAFALDAGNAAAYRHRSAAPPAYATMHPNFRLKPVKHGS